MLCFNLRWNAYYETMKTKEKIVLGSFVFSKLSEKLTICQWFSVLPQILFNSNTAHFHKGGMTLFYSPNSDTQFMTNNKRSCAKVAPISCFTKEVLFCLSILFAFNIGSTFAQSTEKITPHVEYGVLPTISLSLMSKVSIRTGLHGESHVSSGYLKNNFKQGLLKT